MNETYYRREVDVLSYRKMQTSTMMKAEIASTSHPVNDANTQTITMYLNSSRLFSLIHVHSCDVHAMALVISSKSPWPEHGAKHPGAKVRSTDGRAQFAGALFEFETLSHVLAAKPRLREY